MNRNEIALLLREFIASGKIKSKANTGLPYSTINRKIAKGEYYQTSFASIICTDEAVRDKFELLIFQQRIMDGTTVKVHRGYNTLYAITKACADGEMLRFPDLGNSSILYID